MPMNQVECLVCNQMLQYDDNHTEVLIQHLNDFHSNKEVFRYLGGFSKPKPTHPVKWDPQHPLECPYCEKEGRAVLRRKEKAPKPQGRVLGNLFWCWPLCCLSVGRKTYSHEMSVHCSYCSRLIGTYDSRLMKLTRCNSE